MRERKPRKKHCLNAKGNCAKVNSRSCVHDTPSWRQPALGNIEKRWEEVGDVVLSTPTVLSAFYAALLVIQVPRSAVRSQGKRNFTASLRGMSFIFTTTTLKKLKIRLSLKPPGKLTLFSEVIGQLESSLKTFKQKKRRKNKQKKKESLKFCRC